MSEDKRPYQRGLFDDDEPFTPAQGGTPKSLFGDNVPPTPRQNVNPGAGTADAPWPTAQGGAPAARSGQNPAARQGQQRPAAPAQGQGMPRQGHPAQPANPQPAQARPPQQGQAYPGTAQPAGGQAMPPRQPAQNAQAAQPRRQAAPQQGQPGAQARAQQNPGAQPRTAPQQGGPAGARPTQQAQQSPAQQAAQRAQSPAPQQGQRPAQAAQPRAQHPPQQSAAGTPQPRQAAPQQAGGQAQPATHAQGQGQGVAQTTPGAPAPQAPRQQVYKQADSGQRLSQFAPKPAAQRAPGPAQRPTPAAPPAEGATRVIGQNAPQNQPAAPLGDATRVGQRVTPQNAVRYEENAPTADVYPQDQNRIGAQSPAGRANADGPGGGGSGGNGGGNGNGPTRGNGNKDRGAKAPKKGGKPNNKKEDKYMFVNLGKFVLTAGCVCLIIAAILFVQIATYVVASTADDDLVLDLNAIASSQTGYIYAKDANGEHTIEYYEIIGDSNFSWASLSGISPYVVDALVSTEDKEFYDHNGVSWSRTAYAALNEVFPLRDSQFGASTIHQQLVKNLTGDAVVRDEESGMSAGYMRKMREIFRAIGINNSYSKEMVMEAYLNTMPLTGTIKGVGAGAKVYFNKTPAELELHEAATIVGITNWPTKYHPYNNPEACLERRNDVLYFMHEDGKITDAEYQNALDAPLGVTTGNLTQTNDTVTTWFVDAVLNQVRDDLYASERFEFDSLEAASNYVYNGGLQIEATVDLSIQQALEEMYLHAYEEGSPFPDVYVEEDGTRIYPQSAMTIMDYSGNVLASVGGTGEKTVSRALNRASMSPRQVGSTMKGISAYALGLEYNLITYSTNLMDSYSWFRSGVPSYNADGTGAYDWPTNYADKITNAPMGVYTAVAQSTNTVAVRVGIAVGPEEMFDFAKYTLGLKHLDEVEDMGYSSLVLGGQYKGATTEEMAAAYAIYGNGGQFNSPRYYTRVLDSQGNVLLRADDYTIQAVSEETAYIMNRLLYNVMTMSGGTANGMGVNGFETIGKTGTTSDDKDRWFVGMTPYYVGAIWWGYDDNYEISHSPAASTNGTTVPWMTIMNQIHEGLEEKSFPEAPAGIVTQAFCRETGLLATEECGNRGTGYYKADNLPENCIGHNDAPEEGEAPPAE